MRRKLVYIANHLEAVASISLGISFCSFWFKLIALTQFQIFRTLICRPWRGAVINYVFTCSFVFFFFSFFWVFHYVCSQVGFKLRLTHLSCLVLGYYVSLWLTKGLDLILEFILLLIGGECKRFDLITKFKLILISISGSIVYIEEVYVLYNINWILYVQLNLLTICFY